MKICITGASGLIGKHVQCFLKKKKDIEVVTLNRSNFENNSFDEAKGSDAIIHLAGLCRGEKILETNVGLTNKLISFCEKANIKPHIVFSSSTHIYKNTEYGNSKLESALLLSQWANKNGAKLTNLIMPNIFGEWGKPFYNSVVSTFCYQLSKGQKPTVLGNDLMEQVHAQDIAKSMFNHIQNGDTGTILIDKTQKINVGELLNKLVYFSESYRNNIIPDLKDQFDLNLFNTYRSYLYPEYYPKDLELKTDNRGSLYESIKLTSGGQVFISTTKPGITRGNHYHEHKVERFLVLKGLAKISVRNILEKESKDFIVSGTSPQFIDMPTFYTHNITNIGNNELITLFWANEIFNPESPDTYQENV